MFVTKVLNSQFFLITSSSASSKINYILPMIKLIRLESLFDLVNFCIQNGKWNFQHTYFVNRLKTWCLSVNGRLSDLESGCLVIHSPKIDFVTSGFSAPSSIFKNCRHWLNLLLKLFPEEKQAIIMILRGIFYFKFVLLHWSSRLSHVESLPGVLNCMKNPILYSKKQDTDPYSP